MPQSQVKWRCEAFPDCLRKFRSYIGTYPNLAHAPVNGVPTTACRTYSAAVLQEIDTALATWAVKHAVDGTVHGSSVEQKCSYVEEVSEASL